MWIEGGGNNPNRSSEACMAEPEPLGNSSHSSGDMPYAKRCRREPASNSKATLKGWWQQKSYRSSDGRFVSKKDTAAAIAQEVKATHEMERRAWAAPYFPPVRSTDGVIVGVATEPVPAQTTSVWLGKKLERSKLQRNEHIRKLRVCMGRGNYNTVIQPTPGIFEEDELFDRYFPRPDGTIYREVVGPVLMTEAQRDRLFMQCYSVSEFMRALNQRDEQYLKDQAEFEAACPSRGRTVRPVQLPANTVAEKVVSELGLELSWKTVANWCVAVATLCFMHHKIECLHCVPLKCLNIIPIDCSRHRQYVENNGHFMPLMRGKYESANILDDYEDLKKKFKAFMLENLRAISTPLVHKWVNSTLLIDVPAAILAEYNLTLPIHPTTVWRMMKDNGAKNEKYQQGYFNDHHDSA